MPRKKSEPVLTKDKESSPEVEVEVTQTESAVDVETPATPKVATKPKEKFFEVYFLDKQSESELDYHYLAVNGEALQITKGQTVTVPERFLEVANNAIIPQYKRGRKIGEVSRCPYRIIRESTQAEYLKMKREGTAKHRKDIEEQSRAAEKSVEA